MPMEVLNGTILLHPCMGGRGMWLVSPSLLVVRLKNRWVYHQFVASSTGARPRRPEGWQAL